MRRAVRQRLALVLVVAALAVTALWQWRHDAAASPATLLPLDPDAITRVTLALPGHPTERYVRHDGHWWRDGEPPVAADEGRLEQLTGIAAAQALAWRPLSDFDPARIGLTHPVATLTLDDRTLRFGDTSATGPLRYVQVGDRVALVPILATPRPPKRDAIQLQP
ncbi:hypothetical protein ATSB10_26230 [Dyella thiooxydans]|uniref:DUF4340 domain-containing protein n=1 Tax=Dyella thiooxydans TaxID=445710 RepID=A0A160N344_9GAMM|nr:hypothetical protein [Dyella thiooxydans]AND70077.1 hypothetical protein ATSB10_26230 [Dyella thiooxydans]